MPGGVDDPSRTLRLDTPDGVTLVGDVRGAGRQTVVLAHGGGQTRHAWRNTGVALVEAGYRVFRYDLRGHGDSGAAPDGDYSILRLASDLACLVEAAEGPVAVVGASLGGLAAFYAVGSGRAEPVNCLVLLDTVLRPSTQGTERIRRFMGETADGFADLEAAADAITAYSGRARPTPDALRRQLRAHTDGRWRWLWDPAFLTQADSIEDRTARLLSVADRVTIPVLVLRGELSDIVSDDALVEMRDRVPHLETRTALGATHMVSGAANDAFTAEIMRFLLEEAPPSQGDAL